MTILHKVLINLVMVVLLAGCGASQVIKHESVTTVKSASEKLVRSMFIPAADPRLVTSVVDQMSVAEPQMGAGAMYELFRWSARKNPSLLDSYASKLRNINADPAAEGQASHESVTPGVGHFVAQVKPDEFNEALESVLLQFQSQ